MERSLIYERQGPIVTVTFNRPESRNSFDQTMAESFAAAIKTASRDDQTRVVIITGSGSSFSSGQDVFELHRKEQAGVLSAPADELRERYLPIIIRLREIGKPVIAAINGVATGAGLGIALASDIRVASENAEFIMSPVGLGLIPGAGISFFLPLLAGYARAAELTFLGERVSAELALSLGLVNHVVPAGNLMQTSMELAERLATKSVSAIELTKRALNRRVLRELEEHLRYEADLQEIAAATNDHQRLLEQFVSEAAKLRTN